MLTVGAKFRLRMWTSAFSSLMKLLQQPICISLMEIHGLSLTFLGSHVWREAERDQAQMVKQCQQHKIKLHLKISFLDYTNSYNIIHPTMWQNPCLKGAKCVSSHCESMPLVSVYGCKCVGRTTLFKNQSASLSLSDVSWWQAAVIHQACSLCSLLWACYLTWGSRSLEAVLIEPRLCGHGWGWVSMPGVWPGLCVSVHVCALLYYIGVSTHMHTLRISCLKLAGENILLQTSSFLKGKSGEYSVKGQMSFLTQSGISFLYRLLPFVD